MFGWERSRAAIEKGTQAGAFFYGGGEILKDHTDSKYKGAKATQGAKQTEPFRHKELFVASRAYFFSSSGIRRLRK